MSFAKTFAMKHNNHLCKRDQNIEINKCLKIAETAETPTTTQTPVTCPEGWETYRSACYLFQPDFVFVSTYHVRC